MPRLKEKSKDKWQLEIICNTDNTKTQYQYNIKLK